MKKDLQWFLERIGKKVYRLNNICDCEICKYVHNNGLLVIDNQHAQYLFDCQNELDLIYSENKKQETIN